MVLTKLCVEVITPVVILTVVELVVLTIASFSDTCTYRIRNNSCIKNNIKMKNHQAQVLID